MGSSTWFCFGAELPIFVLCWHLWSSFESAACSANIPLPVVFSSLLRNLWLLEGLEKFPTWILAEFFGSHDQELVEVLVSNYFTQSGGFPSGSDGKGSACNVGDLGSIPRLGRSPGEGHDYLLQYSSLENPMDRGAWWATVCGVSKSLRSNWLTEQLTHHLSKHRDWMNELGT